MVFPRLSYLFHLPYMQEQAGGVRSWPFDAVSAPYTSLACQIEPDVDVHGALALSTPPPPPSHARPNWRWFHGVQLLGLIGSDMVPDVEQSHDNHSPKV